jgi:hypothetical protein
MNMQIDIFPIQKLIEKAIEADSSNGRNEFRKTIAMANCLKKGNRQRPKNMKHRNFTWADGWGKPKKKKNQMIMT